MAGVSDEAFDQDFGSRGQQPNDRMKAACRGRQRTEKQECGRSPVRAMAGSRMAAIALFGWRPRPAFCQRADRLGHSLHFETGAKLLRVQVADFRSFSECALILLGNLGF